MANQDYANADGPWCAGGVVRLRYAGLQSREDRGVRLCGPDRHDTSAAVFVNLVERPISLGNESGQRGRSDGDFTSSPDDKHQSAAQFDLRRLLRKVTGFHALPQPNTSEQGANAAQPAALNNPFNALIRPTAVLA